MADNNSSKEKQQTGTPSSTTVPPTTSTAPPGISSSTPETTTQSSSPNTESSKKKTLTFEDGTRIRSASIPLVIDGKGLESPHVQSRIQSPAGSVSITPILAFSPLQPPLLPPLKKTFSGRHRNSGLFSRDDVSADVSITDSQILKALPLLEGARRQSLGPRVGSAIVVARTGSLSIAGSSIGSSSFEGASELHALGGQARKHKYKPCRRKWRRFRRKFKGCIFALLSSLVSSLAYYIVHHLTTNIPKGRKDPYDATYCLLWRYVGVLFPGIFIVLYYRWCQKEMVFDTVLPLKEKEPLIRFSLSIARSVIDVIAVLLNFYAFKTILQSEASTIWNIKPVVVQLLAHFTLGEPWGVVPILTSLLAVVGVLIISKPPFLVPDELAPERNFEDRMKGVGYSIGSMLLSSVVYVILRYLKDVHYSVFSLFIGSVGFTFALGMTLLNDTLSTTPALEDLIYLIGMAALVCLSSIFIVIALQNEEAFVVSLVRSFDVVFSFLWEMSLDGKFPDWYSGGGAAIVIFCVLVVFFRKYVSHQEPDSKIAKYFHFLLK